MKVVIGGAQRSGTSFLRSILGSHSEIAMFPYDLRLWTKYWPEVGPGPLSTSGQKALLNSILLDEKTLIAEDVPSFDQVHERMIQGKQPTISAMYVFDCFLAAYARNRGRSVWGHKTPWNEYYAKDILGEWSDVYFIHLIRNPLHSAISAQHAEGGSWFYDPFLHIERWRKSAELALQNGRTYPDKYMVIRYEDLKANPRLVSQSLCNFLGLKFEKGMETGSKQPGWEGNNSSFLRESSLKGGTRNKSLPPYLEKLYRKKLKPQMEHFGYLDTNVDSRFDSLHTLAVGCHRLWLSAIYLAIRLRKALMRLLNLKLPGGSSL